MAEAQLPTAPRPASMQQRRKLLAGKRAYSIKDLKLMGIGSAPFVYERIRDGDLIATKVGNKTLIFAEHLEAFLASRPRVISNYYPSRRKNKHTG